ncbi:MAG: hypothetical protein JXJ04_08585 [Spirochaetales bacterium]|nr:hypothetical protein [Spirochaetales bacterium]
MSENIEIYSFKLSKIRRIIYILASIYIVAAIILHYTTKPGAFAFLIAQPLTFFPNIFYIVLVAYFLFEASKTYVIINEENITINKFIFTKPIVIDYHHIEDITFNTRSIDIKTNTESHYPYYRINLSKISDEYSIVERLLKKKVLDLKKE